MAEVKSTRPSADSKPENASEPKSEAKPAPKKAESKKTETKTDRHGTPVVSFQELDEPNENLPGVVAPKED